MDILSPNDKKFIEAIIMYLGENMELDTNEALRVFNIKRTNTLEYRSFLEKNNTYPRCKVILENKEQCSRNGKKDGFCKTHHKLFQENKLDKERILPSPQLSLFHGALERVKKARTVAALVRCRLIYQDNQEFFWDPVSYYLYDVKTYARIGRIDSFRQIKLFQEK